MDQGLASLPIELAPDGNSSANPARASKSKVDPYLFELQAQNRFSQVFSNFVLFGAAGFHAHSTFTTQFNLFCAGGSSLIALAGALGVLRFCFFPHYLGAGQLHHVATRYAGTVGIPLVALGLFYQKAGNRFGPPIPSFFAWLGVLALLATGLLFHNLFHLAWAVIVIILSVLLGMMVSIMNQVFLWMGIGAGLILLIGLCIGTKGWFIVSYVLKVDIFAIASQLTCFSIPSPSIIFVQSKVMKKCVEHPTLVEVNEEVVSV
eukprot:CAMPEP_0114547108 /NCGR_PEP_ID=MMETSP0114-20121206/4292_1 /TAXON_ID=31324 /ORGANISM="Goniomonas sp, Strain m" /LENGTH=261 /DNA_ID=CAMNT_0001731649 /DNA_START=42 /DNA_END=825 /DNA_ORIENTATION=-